MVDVAVDHLVSAIAQNPQEPCGKRGPPGARQNTAAAGFNQRRVTTGVLAQGAEIELPPRAVEIRQEFHQPGFDSTPFQGSEDVQDSNGRGHGRRFRYCKSSGSVMSIARAMRSRLWRPGITRPFSTLLT